MRSDKKRNIFISLILIVVTLFLFLGNIFLGSVNIPFNDVLNILGGEVAKTSWHSIILNSRLPMALTAVLAGAALSLSGLLMQTLFRNPLAGPSVLGVTSGASLGVALVILLAGGALSQYLMLSNISVILAALIGAGGVIFLLLLIAGRIGNHIILLIIGLMIGYAVSSLVSVLQFFSADHALHAYVIWGMGSFSKVGWQNMIWFGSLVLLAVFATILLIKPLNLILLGDNYAHNMGLNMRRNRVVIISVSGMLAALVTAYCGPVAFLGVAVPHIARNLYRSNDHKVIVPGVILSGASFALFVNLLSRLPGASGALPVNALSSLIGAPIVVWVILRNRRKEMV